MAPPLAVRVAVAVLRQAYANMRTLIETQLPESVERTDSLSALDESMELAMRGALDMIGSRPPSRE